MLTVVVFPPLGSKVAVEVRFRTTVLLPPGAAVRILPPDMLNGRKP